MSRNDNLDDLPDVPDGPVDDDSRTAPALTDDEAARQINRRVSPIGWVLLVSALGGGGATGYYMYQSAQQQSLEDSERDRGRAELEAILLRDLGPTETAREVRALYGRYRSDGVRQSARRILAGLRDPEAVPMLIEGLDRPGAARAQSALGLAEIGSPAADAAKPALLRVLPLTDPHTDRIEVAWALTVLNEPAAWPVVRELLETNRLQMVNGLDGRRSFDPALVARMAGRERLRELVTSRNLASRQLAAISLAEIASPEVIDDLGVLSRDPQESVAREAAIGLGRTGDRRAVDSIMAFLRRFPAARDGVLAALATSSGAQGLGVVIQGSRDLPTQARATQLLRDQRDPGAGDALFAALEVARASNDEAAREMKKNAIFGLAEIGDLRAVDGLLEYVQFGIEHPADVNGTQDAKLALEQIRRIPGASARAKDRLLAFLRMPTSDFVRSPLILALALSGDPALGAVIQPFLAQADAQEGAAQALCALRSPQCFSTVAAQARQPANLRMVDETVRDEEILIRRRSALRGMAWAAYEPPPGSGVTLPAMTAAQRQSLVRELRRIIEDPTDRPSLREEAGYALAAVADDGVLTEIAAQAANASAPEERRIFYIYALRARCTPAIATQLVQTYLRRGVSAEVMKAAAVAAGFGADDATVDVLLPLLQGTDPQDANVRFAAAVALVLGGNARAGTALVEALSANDELTGILQNFFTPRSSGSAGNDSVLSERREIMPLTRAMFEDGRVYRRMEVAQLLERGRNSKQFVFAMLALTTRLRAGWDSPIGAGALEVRRLLRETALGSDPGRRVVAFSILRALADRGSLHALQRQTANPAASELARRELLAMTASAGGR